MNQKLKKALIVFVKLLVSLLILNLVVPYIFPNFEPVNFVFILIQAFVITLVLVFRDRNSTSAWFRNKWYSCWRTRTGSCMVAAAIVDASDSACIRKMRAQAGHIWILRKTESIKYVFGLKRKEQVVDQKRFTVSLI